MKIVIDRIEENIAVCENLETREMLEINLDLLPKNIKDGSIINCINGKYEIDLDEEKERRRKIQERFNKLKRN